MKKTRKYFTIIDLHSAFLKNIGIDLKLDVVVTILKKGGLKKAGENLIGVNVYDGMHWIDAWNLLWIHYRKTHSHVFDVQPSMPPALPLQEKAIWIN